MHVCIAPFYLTCLNCGFPPVISFAISNSFQQLQKSRPAYNNKNKNEKKKKKKALTWSLQHLEIESHAWDIGG